MKFNKVNLDLPIQNPGNCAINKYGDLCFFLKVC